MSVPTAEQLSLMTPMLKQYFDLKKECSDTILFFRMGDFYEVFGEDAEIIAPKINIVLTSRERGDKQKIKFCGVPHHSAQNYWMKLLAMNFKIAVAEQIEDPQVSKGLVKRAITKIMTPGCLDDLDGLDSNCPNYLMAIYEDPKTRQWAITLADLSTGELRLGQAQNFDEIIQIISHFEPKEILLRKFFQETAKNILSKNITTQKILIATLNERILGDQNSQKELLDQTFGKSKLSHHTNTTGQALVAATLQHFLDLHASLGQFRKIKPLTEPETVSLDETVISDLEILETSRQRKKEGSLFFQINYTLTPMGARLLRWTLAHPFVSKEKIIERQTQVKDLVTYGSDDLSTIRSYLKNSGDLERLATRILSRRIRPSELAKIKETLLKIKNLYEFFKNKRNSF